MSEATLSTLLEKILHKSVRLDRTDKLWSVQGSQKDVYFRVTDKRSFGFCLDENNRIKSRDTSDGKQVDLSGSPLSFFADSPPSDIAKMCDGILAFTYRGQDYVFCIELKGNCTESYRKQMNNAILFCDWLIALLKQYGYYEKRPCFVGILVKHRPGNVDKNVKDQNYIIGDKNKNDKFDQLLIVENSEEIFCFDICKAIQPAV